jgi:predicted PurR-regulated permease PerM
MSIVVTLLSIFVFVLAVCVFILANQIDDLRRNLPIPYALQDMQRRLEDAILPNREGDEYMSLRILATTAHVRTNVTEPLYALLNHLGLEWVENVGQPKFVPHRIIRKKVKK